MNGWFGEPWWSYVCYGEDGRLLEGLRVPFPEGEDCLGCEERFTPGDSGVQVPLMLASGEGEVRHIHKECQLRSVLGSVAHLEGRCSCYGGTGHDDPARTRRQEALAVWAWVGEHGVRG